MPSRASTHLFALLCTLLWRPYRLLCEFFHGSESRIEVKGGVFGGCDHGILYMPLQKNQLFPWLCHVVVLVGNMVQC